MTSGICKAINRPAPPLRTRSMHTSVPTHSELGGPDPDSERGACRDGTGTSRCGSRVRQCADWESGRRQRHLCRALFPHLAPGLGSPLPHLRRDSARPAHICTGTRRTPLSPALGLRLHRDLHLRRVPRAHTDIALARRTDQPTAKLDCHACASSVVATASRALTSSGCARIGPSARPTHSLDS